MPPISDLLLVSVTMIVGSFVAGFTALGGGAVSFPVLTKLLGYSVADARQFGALIQSVGMTSASILILMRHGVALLDAPTRTYLSGALAGAGLGFFALTVDAPTAKALFSVFILTFGVVALRDAGAGMPPSLPVYAAAGVIGGVLSHNIGTGADGVFFIVSTLLFGGETRRTIWRSIVIMAATSLVLAGLNLAFATISPLVAWSWLFAAPVVVFGAAFGAALTERADAKLLKRAFVTIAVVEFGWTMRWLLLDASFT